MRKRLAVSLISVGLLCLPIVPAQAEVGGRIFAGGGTPLSNGIFFPGTALPNEDGSVTGTAPLELTQGTDIEFINLDEAAVGNGHRIVSLKRRKGRPIFSSDLLLRPGQSDLVVTSHLAPGLYNYFCSVHAGMWGQIQIVQ